MDTRFWGPSGWRLLHLISFAYNPQKDKPAFHRFFEILPFVLPCKYCRSNLTEHYEDNPIDLRSQESLSRWLYKIHNLVNEKLRSQGQHIPPEPSYNEVKEIYTQRLQYGCTKTEFPGWEFLFSVVENHPYSREKSTPLPDAPPLETIDPKDELTLLKWNYITPDCRFNYLCQFWKVLPNVLPFPEWRKAWRETTSFYTNDTWSSKLESHKALWRTRKHIEEQLELLNKTNYHDLCKDIKIHKSGCGKSNRGKTCRKKRKSKTYRH